LKTFDVRPDCRWFLGDRPCKFKRACSECPHYDPPSVRILIIKLAAAGDVLRTTHLIPALKREYPGSHITWVTETGVASFLKELPDVDRVIEWNADLPFLLGGDIGFDILINLDKEPKATGLAQFVRADRKLGFLPAPGHGGLIPADANAGYLYRLGLDDHLKFHVNRKTYQQIIHEVAGLDDKKERYPLVIPGKVAIAVAERLQVTGKIKPVIIGLNTGSGDVFANKSWNEWKWMEFIETLSNSVCSGNRCRIFLLGGPSECRKNAGILKKLNSSGRVGEGFVTDTGCDNSMIEFGAVVDLCDVIVTGDTFAMHVAVGLGKHVVAFFGPTSADEIELYGRGRLLRSPLECGPCYRRSCDIEPSCMDLLPVRVVADAVEECLNEIGVGTWEFSGGITFHPYHSAQLERIRRFGPLSGISGKSRLPCI